MEQLATNGGKPVRTKPWACNITTGEEEKQAVARVMESGYLSLFEGSHEPEKPFSFYGGPEVQTLERMWREKYRTQYAVSVNSATSGLYAAVGALDIGYGDEVIVSPYTMSACATAPLVYGAIPVFADVEPETGCLDPESIEERISQRTKAIILVHQFGIPANMSAIMALVKKNNLFLIEDCAQAHGALYHNQSVGTFGDIGVFSLNVNKTIQSGEGGVCVTNSKDLHYRLALIRNHGEAVVAKARYEHISNIIGFNYRMTELQAAVAQEQLKKMDALNKQRIDLALRLSEGLKEFKFLKPLHSREQCVSTFYLYGLRFFEDKAKWTRNEFADMVCAEGIPFYKGYTKPLYYQPLYQQLTAFKNGYPFCAPHNSECLMDYAPGICRHAERLETDELLLNEYIRYPHNAEDVDDIIAGIRKVVTYG